jgi:DNA-binding cell septation regulator SpoVG
LDDIFLVKDLRLLQNEETGNILLAFPSRKLFYSCPGCGRRNCADAAWCNYCRGALDPETLLSEAKLRESKLHVDVAHPLTQELRLHIQREVLRAYYNSGKEVKHHVPPTAKPATTPPAPGFRADGLVQSTLVCWRSGGDP